MSVVISRCQCRMESVDWRVSVVIDSRCHHRWLNAKGPTVCRSRPRSRHFWWRTWTLMSESCLFPSVICRHLTRCAFSMYRSRMSASLFTNSSAWNQSHAHNIPLHVKLWLGKHQSTVLTIDDTLFSHSRSSYSIERELKPFLVKPKQISKCLPLRHLKSETNWKLKMSSIES